MQWYRRVLVTPLSAVALVVAVSGAPVSSTSTDLNASAAPEADIEPVSSLQAAKTLYVDKNLPADCLSNDYSIAQRSCTGTDGNAYTTMQRAADVVLAGETVMVRDGVYADTGVNDSIRGQVGVRAKRSGTATAPITFSAYPGEKPIIDGGQRIETWRPCASPQECGNNPRWQQIYIADAPPGVTSQSPYISENDTLLYRTQNPEPQAPFYWDQPATWSRIPANGYTTTTIRDPTFFNQLDPDYWTGAYVHIWSCNNNVILRPIRSYDPATGTITFDALTCSAHLTPGKDKYAVLNHLSLLNTPGEYYIDDTNAKLYLLPHNVASLNNVYAAVRTKGFDIRGNDYLIIDGLTFRRFTGEAIANYNFGPGYTATGVIARNNTIYNNRGPGFSVHGLSDSTADNNIVHDVMGNGVYFNDGANNVISNNKLRKVGASGLRFYRVTNGSIIDNENIDSNGQHANGITIYLDSDTVMVKRNRVINSNIALTFQSSINITIEENYFEGPGNQIAGWSGSYKGVPPTNVLIKNNTIRGSVLIDDVFEDVTVKDNILAGGGSTGTTHSHNLYTARAWNETYNLADFNESLEPDEHKIFHNSIDKGNYRVKLNTLGQPPINPCTMSSTGSHVGAYPCSC